MIETCVILLINAILVNSIKITFFLKKCNLQWKGIYHITELGQQNFYLGNRGLIYTYSTYNNFAKYFFSFFRLDFLDNFFKNLQRSEFFVTLTSQSVIVAWLWAKRLGSETKAWLSITQQTAWALPFYYFPMFPRCPAAVWGHPGGRCPYNQLVARLRNINFGISNLLKGLLENLPNVWPPQELTVLDSHQIHSLPHMDKRSLFSALNMQFRNR